MMTTALIFDCDGTLTDSMPLHYRAWTAVLEPLGIEFTEQRFYQLAGVPGHEVLRQISKTQLSDNVSTELLQQREDLFFELLPQVQPITPIVDIAKENVGRKKMAVASGSIRASVHAQLHGLQIFDLFEAIVAAEDTDRHKPEPDVFLEAARLLGVTPGECRVYEDSDLGLEAANQAGMEAIDIRPLVS